MVFRKQSHLEDTADPIEVTSVKGGDQTESADLDEKIFDGEIYVMPREFYKKIHKNKRTSKSLFIILIVALVLFAFGMASIYVFIIKDSTDIESLLEEPVLPAENTISPEQNATTTEEEAEETATSTENTKAGEEETEIVEAGAEFIFLPLLPASLDIDADGLTDVEESLMGTDAKDDDTDDDSYLDGAELLAGFDPNAPGKDISSSGIFQTYENIDPVFSFQLPSAWQLAENSTDAKKIFLAGNGDVIVLELFANQPPFTLTKWLADTYPATDIRVFSQTAFDSFVGLEAQNGRQVIINLGSHVSLFTYDVNGKAEVGYPTVWEYILRSFSS